MASFKKLVEKPMRGAQMAQADTKEGPLSRKDKELRDVKEFLGMQKKHEEAEGDTEQAKKLKDFEKRNKQLTGDLRRK